MKQITNLPSDGQGMVMVEMSVSEYLELIKGPAPTPNIQRGLDAIMALFKCSRATAFRISHSDWFAPAIIDNGGKLVLFDANMALELAKNRR